MRHNGVMGRTSDSGNSELELQFVGVDHKGRPFRRWVSNLRGRIQNLTGFRQGTGDGLRQTSALREATTISTSDFTDGRKLPGHTRRVMEHRATAYTGDHEVHAFVAGGGGTTNIVVSVDGGPDFPLDNMANNLPPIHDIRPVVAPVHLRYAPERSEDGEQGLMLSYVDDKRRLVDVPLKVNSDGTVSEEADKDGYHRGARSVVGLGSRRAIRPIGRMTGDSHDPILTAEGVVLPQEWDDSFLRRMETLSSNGDWVDADVGAGRDGRVIVGLQRNEAGQTSLSVVAGEHDVYSVPIEDGEHLVGVSFSGSSFMNIEKEKDSVTLLSKFSDGYEMTLDTVRERARATGQGSL